MFDWLGLSCPVACRCCGADVLALSLVAVVPVATRGDHGHFTVGVLDQWLGDPKFELMVNSQLLPIHRGIGPWCWTVPC